jgi:cytochrome b involved in lipid metabolism
MGDISKTPAAMEAAMLPEFTAKEVAAHNRPDDLWIIVHGEGA